MCYPYNECYMRVGYCGIVALSVKQRGLMEEVTQAGTIILISGLIGSWRKLVFRSASLLRCFSRDQ